jgi:hypothetical protein
VINNIRLADDKQRAGGWIQVASAIKLFFYNAGPGGTIQGNTVLFNFNLGSDRAILVAANNSYVQVNNTN